MPAHELAVRVPHGLQRVEVLALVEHIPGQAHDVLGPSVRLREHFEDVGERLAELAREIARFPFAFAGPAHLAGNEHELPARSDSIGEAFRSRPAGRLEDIHGEVLSLKRCSLPVSVRGSVSTNSMARGYL